MGNDSSGTTFLHDTWEGSNWTGLSCRCTDPACVANPYSSLLTSVTAASNAVLCASRCSAASCTAKLASHCVTGSGTVGSCGATPARLSMPSVCQCAWSPWSVCRVRWAWSSTTVVSCHTTRGVCTSTCAGPAAQRRVPRSTLSGRDSVSCTVLAGISTAAVRNSVRYTAEGVSSVPRTCVSSSANVPSRFHCTGGAANTSGGI